MTDETIAPILPAKAPLSPTGRRVDLFAFVVAAIGALFAVICAAWFFLGFAENDKRPEHLASALVLTLGLFIFAIGPFINTAIFARRAYRQGTKRAHLIWTLFLMLPWIGLGILTMIYTPLPIWVGLILASLAAFLTLWASVSLILDWTTKPANTGVSQQNEVSVTSE